MKTIRAAKLQKVTGMSWWQSNRRWVSLVLPEDETTDSLSEGTNFEKVKKQMSVVASSCGAGALVVGPALRQLDYDGVHKHVENNMQILFSTDVTLDTWAASTQQFQDDLEEAGLSPFKVHAAKDVAVEYRCCTLYVEATSPLDHFSTAIHAKMLGLVVECGGQCHRSGLNAN